jgi:subtilisin family serine protease
MKTFVTMFAVAAVASIGKAVSQPVVPVNAWTQVYGELMQCVQSMGFCRDAAPLSASADDGVELGHHSKEDCIGNSLMYWQEPYSSVKMFKDAVEARDQEDKTEVDYFLIRRDATKSGISTVVTNALIGGVPAASLEGYVRCGASEYVYVSGPKREFYAKAAAFGFDVVLPVPLDLRISGLVTVYRDGQAVQAESPLGVTCSNEIRFDLKAKALPKCTYADFQAARTLDLTMTLMTPNARRSLNEAVETANRLDRNLRAHGRNLAAAGEELTVKATTDRHVLVSNISAINIAELLVSVGLEFNVVWVALATQYDFANYHTATIVQSGSVRERIFPVNSTDVDYSLFKPTIDPVLTPFWTRGITGKNQIVGIGDSGLQTDHCMFTDDKVDVNTAERQRIGGNIYYPGHRKLINYVSFADGIAVDNIDRPDHGTHVAGTVAGSVQKSKENSTGLFSVTHKGVAPDSKISFVDIAFSSGRFSIPDNLIDDYLMPQYKAGARIQTNSWRAYFRNDYNDFARAFDKFSFENQDFVALVCAGNEDFHRGSAGSIGAPATAKNVISVGASMNSDVMLEEDIAYNDGTSPGTLQCNMLTRSATQGKCEDSLASFSCNGPTFDHRIAPDVVAPGEVILVRLFRVKCLSRM